jgi:hypothetical protein
VSRRAGRSLSTRAASETGRRLDRVSSFLYVFKGNTDGDGATPSGGLVIDGSGNLYGVTAYGGTGNCVLLGILGGVWHGVRFSPP